MMTALETRDTHNSSILRTTSRPSESLLSIDTMKSNQISISQITTFLNFRSKKMTTKRTTPKHCQKLSITHGAILTSSTKTTALLCLFTCTLLALFASQLSEARMNIIAPTPPNQFYLNEYCDLHSKAPINKNKHKQDSETKLFLNNKNLFSSMRVQPETRRNNVQPQEAQEQKRAASGISFEFNATNHNAPIIKQLNCFFVVVAPKSHGLLMNVNSIGLPKNQTKLTITLNHESNHSQLIHLEGEEKPSQYLLTQDGNSKIAIHLQSFRPIDWSHISFDILFTVYRKASNSGCPNKRWFDCGDNICVPASLVCDKTPHCPNGNDEMIFYKCYSSLFWSMALTASLVLILVITVSIILFISRRRQGRLNRQNSLSDNVLTADADNLSSRLDFSDNQHRNQSASYLKSNLFYNGFENPVWTSNPPTKLQQQQQNQNNFINQSQQQGPSITSSPSTNQPHNSQQHRPSLLDGPHLGLDLAVASASGVHR